MMKILFDFLPIALFFATYKMYNLIVATQVAIAASLLQLLWLRFRTGEFQKVNLISFFSILLLGGATLLFNNEIFVKWKPTAVYWILALFFFGSHFFGPKPLLERFGESSIHLPSKVWRTLNLSWVVFFGLMGLTNIYVVYNFDTDVWVNFKLFGTLGLTIVFILGQSLYMAKHSQMQNGNS